MSPVEMFVVATSAVAISDFLVWERVNWLRNWWPPDGEKLPLFFRPAMRLEGFQVGRWFAVGSLITACNVFAHSSVRGLLVATTLILYTIHLLLAIKRFRSLYSARSREESKGGDVKK